MDRGPTIQFFTLLLVRALKTEITRLVSLLFIAVSLFSQSFAESNPKIEIAPEEFEAALRENITRVDEFNFIRAEAKKLGVKVYLFGGTAAGYGHYVRMDLLRKKGDKRFQPDRFTYGYENIFRSTQDADLVVDGPENAISKLKYSLREKFPHLQGDKTAWELRSLKEDVDNKGAILNEDFRNQHSDSNSTGLIEISETTDKSIVKDARDWPKERSNFFEDIRLGKITFYFSKDHERNSRYKSGLNPPILSVIRYLTKKYQYELQTRPEDEAKLKEIINTTDLNKLTTYNSYSSGSYTTYEYLSKWLPNNGRKIFLHAVNLEYAWNDLEKLGLRKKLLATESLGSIEREKTLAWWMHKEPLREKPLGEGNGKKAKDLGIDIVAHNTKDFLAFESITRSHMGFANALISREGVAGETAAFGDGFYVRLGRNGAVPDGIPIRFKMNPEAREGSDFLIAENTDYLVILNKAALTIIPEAINMNPTDLVNLHVTGEMTSLDRGQLFKIERNLKSKDYSKLRFDEFEEILNIFKREKLRTDHFEVVETVFRGLISTWLKNDEQRTIATLTRAISDADPSQREILSYYMARGIRQADPTAFDRFPNLTRLLIASGSYYALSQMIVPYDDEKWGPLRTSLLLKEAAIRILHHIKIVEDLPTTRINEASGYPFLASITKAKDWQQKMPLGITQILNVMPLVEDADAEDALRVILMFPIKIRDTLNDNAISQIFSQPMVERFSNLIIELLSSGVWDDTRVLNFVTHSLSKNEQLLMNKELRTALFQRISKSKSSTETKKALVELVLTRDKTRVMDEVAFDFLSLSSQNGISEKDVELFCDHIACRDQFSNYPKASARLFELGEGPNFQVHVARGLLKGRSSITYLPTVLNFLNNKTPKVMEQVHSLLFTQDHFRDPAFDQWREFSLFAKTSSSASTTSKIEYLPDCKTFLRHLGPPPLEAESASKVVEEK